VIERSIAGSFDVAHVSELFADEIFRAPLVPHPLIRQRRLWREPLPGIGIGREPALIEQRYEMSAVAPLRMEPLVDEERRGVEFNR
jgi:hypothetical protein